MADSNQDQVNDILELLKNKDVSIRKQALMITL